MNRFYGQKKSANIIIHRINNVERQDIDSNFLRIVSIDPGKVNLAFRIETRYNNGRTDVEVYQKININQIEDDSSAENESSFKSEDVYMKFNNLLNQYIPYFMKTNIIIIERQILPNYDMIRVCQHFITYFTLLLCNSPLNPLLIEVEPGYKNRFFKMPKGSNAHSWVVDRAYELFELRQDIKSSQLLSSQKGKKDDLAVTAVQAEAVLQSINLARPFPPKITYVLHISKDNDVGLK